MDFRELDSSWISCALPAEDSEYRPFPDSDPTDNSLRFVVERGSNTNGSLDIYVTPGGAARSRPAFVGFGGGVALNLKLSGARIDRVWHYETLPNSSGTVYQYFLMSAYDIAGAVWKMYYNNITGGVLAYTLFPSARDVNASIAPHRVVVSRGLAYVMGFPAGGSSEKFGTVIFDGSNGTPVVRLWGIPGPTTPARMSGWIGRLDASITETTTAVVVRSVTAPPATPFTYQIGLEEILCTAKAGAGPTYTLTSTRAQNGTTAARYDQYTPAIYRDWSVADHQIDVRTGWKYSYAYKSITGQISNRVDIEKNEDLMPSNTFPFHDLRPKMTLVGNSDTTNITKVEVYRTPDGQADFLFLEEVNNPGAGTFTYEDDSHGTGSSSTTFQDPVPDAQLPSARVAPSLVSNSPPFRVIDPLITGTDAPSVNVSNMVVFQGRIWYAIMNVLFYSSEEEVSEGIPEESFKGGVKGNFIRFPATICSIQSTASALYVMTTEGVHKVVGAGAETGWREKKIGDKVAMRARHFNASCSFMERVAFVTSDLRVAVITDEAIDIISEAIRGVTDTDDLTSGKLQMEFLADDEHQWLIVLDGKAHNFLNGYGTLFIYDWKRSLEERRDFWFPNWLTRLRAIAVYPFGGTATLAGITYDSDGATKSSALVNANFTLGFHRDDVLNNTAWTTETSLFHAHISTLRIPSGNHVNVHSAPAISPLFTGFALDYLAENAGMQTGNIGAVAYLDNRFLSGAGTTKDLTGNQTNSTRHNASSGYMSKEFRMQEAAQDVSVKISNGALTAETGIAIYRLRPLWHQGDEVND